ncbi:uncharacterized protein BcabD6B2_02250 [Babesia caballi]|uniref:Uncharacterized protein n=1 Tax=Babesia caballi TaxID=5871 RepID=A0AAV4LLQ1_BABCB|nr:hypothetical protein, conserved [Babesia caballi]
MKGNSCLEIPQGGHVRNPPGMASKGVVVTSNAVMRGTRCLTTPQDEHVPQGIERFVNAGIDEHSKIMNAPQFAFADGYGSQVLAFDNVGVSEKHSKHNIQGSVASNVTYSSNVRRPCKQAVYHVQPVENLRIVAQQPNPSMVVRNYTAQLTPIDSNAPNTITPSGSQVVWSNPGSVDYRFVPAKFTTLQQDAHGNLIGKLTYHAVQQPQFGDEIIYSGCPVDTFDNDWVEDDIYDITETNFDFATLTGYPVDTDDVDPASVSIIDMICGISDSPEDPLMNSRQPMVINMPVKLEPEPVEAPLYKKMQAKLSAIKKSKMNKKVRGSRGNKHSNYLHHSDLNQLALEAPLESINASLGEDETVQWTPGFSRQLGAKGRSALLDLVRRVYRQDPPRYKAILQARTPPASISNLPFFNIPMLWELTHQFGVFKQALLIHKSQSTGLLRGERGRGRSRFDRYDRGLMPVNRKLALPQSSQTQTRVSQHEERRVEVAPAKKSEEKKDVVPPKIVEVSTPPETNPATQKRQEMNGITALVQGSMDYSAAKKHERVPGDSAAQATLSKQGSTAFSGRSLKETKRCANLRDDADKPAKRHNVVQDYHSQSTQDSSSISGSSDSSNETIRSDCKEYSPAPTMSSVASPVKSDAGAPSFVQSAHQSPQLSLVWSFPQKPPVNIDAEREAISDRMSPLSSARSTPTRCISV